MDVGWPGSTHDSRIWQRSEAKTWLEAQISFKCAGDSGYPISEVLVKPYETAEAGNVARKRLFNKRLSSARTVMTENIFGMWKQRFPILRDLRCHLTLSQKIIVATAILENMAREWGEEPIEDENEEDDGDRDNEDIVIIDAAENVRRRGQIARDAMLAEMP